MKRILFEVDYITYLSLPFDAVHLLSSLEIVKQEGTYDKPIFRRTQQARGMLCLEESLILDADPS